MSEETNVQNETENTSNQEQAAQDAPAQEKPKRSVEELEKEIQALRKENAKRRIENKEQSSIEGDLKDTREQLAQIRKELRYSKLMQAGIPEEDHEFLDFYLTKGLSESEAIAKLQEKFSPKKSAKEEKAKLDTGVGTLPTSKQGLSFKVAKYSEMTIAQLTELSNKSPDQYRKIYREFKEGKS